MLRTPALMMMRMHGWLALIAMWMVGASVAAGGLQAAGPQQASAPSEAEADPSRALLDRYCVSCHNERVVSGRDAAPSPLASQLRAVGLMLDTLDPSNVGSDLETWETVVRKLRAGMMPPAGRPRPDDVMRDAFLARLETDLDAAWAARAEVPRTAILHRLNRAEYGNVIRDLLALDVDLAALLPTDDASYGFDNIADALGVSPLLLERYLTTARRVSRLAVGRSSVQPSEATYLAPLDLTQDGHVPGLPLGTRSLLDSVTADVGRLQKELGASDRRRVDEYLEAIRETERRIQKTEEYNSTQELAVPERPIGIPEDFGTHAKLMIDLQVLAYQADLTRVTTFAFGHEASYRTFPEIGVSDPHHSLSHHQNNDEKLVDLGKVNHYHVETLAYYLGKLRSSPEGDGNLLDHSLLLYGSGMSDGNLHNHSPLPIVVAGGAAGRCKGGRHVSCPAETPMSNLLLSMLDMVGVRTDRLGDSTGRLTDL